MVRVREDMTGWIMSEHGVPKSKLTVIRQVEDHIQPCGKHKDMWLCQCSCGSTPCIIRGDLIKDGSTLSCGCVWQEVKRRYNVYDLSGEYGIGWTSNTNQEFYFDLDDYDKIKDYCWYEVQSTINQLCATIDYKVIRFHNFLGFKYYDHINRNELDNRKSNLRPATFTENAQNRSLFKNNTSGITGVGWHKNTNNWRARITVNNKQICLGYFDNKEDAIKARLRAEQKYFGEFAPQRHLFQEYKITKEREEVDRDIN